MPHVNVGDQVIVRQPQTGKLVSAYNPAPVRVSDIKGTMVTAGNDDIVKTRNISHFKKVSGYQAKPEPDIVPDDDDCPKVAETQSCVPQSDVTPVTRRTSARAKTMPAMYKDFIMK